MYNYEQFTPNSYDFTTQTGIKIGDRLPELTLQNVEGVPIQLSSYLGKILVLETGSLTCPLYVGKIKKMALVAKKYPHVEFLLIYIREAHPGRKINAHGTSKSKLRNANRLQQDEPENRSVLVDDLQGTLHAALGLLPNMAFVIGTDGAVLYRADWNIPDRIEEVLDAIEKGLPLLAAPADFTPVAPIYSLRVLARAGGMRAIWDFLTHLPRLIKQHKAHWKSRNGTGK